jgi:branched-chain amino acid transport system permease protein
MSHVSSEASAGLIAEPTKGSASKSLIALSVGAATLAAYALLPFIGSDYWFSAILIPFLIMSLAGLGLNIMMGYSGQASLGTGAFMAVGAYATYNVLLRLPDLPLPISLLVGGLITGFVGLIVGLPSLRIKGFYLIATTLAAQFFIEWLFNEFRWFSNYANSISAPRLTFFGADINTPSKRYLLALIAVSIVFTVAWKLVRSQTGRNWMAIRDMDTAAAIVGVPVGRGKLSAFFVGAMICGWAGALWAFAHLGTVDASTFNLDRSFQVMFIVIVGGLGSLIGNFLGAAFIVLLPILIDHLAGALLGGAIDAAQLQNFQKVLFGSLIIWFLIKEPYGLTALVGRLLRWAKALFSR